MDWFSWLSKTSLEPSLIYEYGLAFTNNELEEDDLPHFDHEFLQSMGISIAKHRLEILKLARKESKKPGSPHISRAIIIAIKRTKKYIKTFMYKDKDTQVVVPIKAYNNRWRESRRASSRNTKIIETTLRSDMLKRNKNSMQMQLKNYQQERLLITSGNYGSFNMGPRSSLSSISSTPRVVVYSNNKEDDQKMVRDDVELDYGHWRNARSIDHEIKWDSMFHNLNPT